MFGDHKTVRPSVRLHHRETNVKCQTFKLAWEPVTCVFNLIIDIHTIVN